MNRKSLWISLLVLAVLMFGQAALAREMLGVDSEEPSIPVWDHTYSVQPGDTLSSIADRAGTTLDELAQMNDINDTSFVVTGTQLLVPDDVEDSYDTENMHDTSATDDSNVENAGEGEVEDAEHDAGEQHIGEHEDSNHEVGSHDGGSHEDRGYDD